MLPEFLHTPVGLLLAIISLGVLIIVHEGGHYLVARWSGMRVDRFSIGFGPPIARFQRGETSFQIGLVPLGGFVQIAGLNPGEEETKDVVIGQDGKSVAIPRDTDDKRLYGNRPVYQRLLTIFAGPGTNYLFAVGMMLFVNLVFGMPEPSSGPATVVQVSMDFPAAAAGIEVGDELVSIAGQPVKTRDEVVKVVNAAAGRPVEVVVNRDNVEKRFQVTPKKEGEHYFLGIVPEPRDMVWTHQPIGVEVASAFQFPVRVTVGTLAGLANIFKGKQKADFTGPIGIVREMKKQLLRGPADGLMFVAMISTLLGLFNLLPLPALDGGRLVFLAYEGTVRRKFPQRAEQSIHLVGMVALLSFILYVTVFKDIPRLWH